MNEINSPFSISGPAIIVLFFKAFAIVFSLMYFVYSIVVYRQIKTMSQTIQITDTGVIKRESFIVIITNFQILISLLLFIFSIFVALS